MKESSFLKIVIVCLLLLNLGTLGYLWLGGQRHGPGHPPPHGRHRGNAAEFIRRNVQLTDSQETLYRHMRTAHHAQVEDIRDSMRSNQHALYLLLNHPNPDNAQVDVYLNNIASGQRRIESITFLHFRELRGICTPQQQEALQKSIEEALSRL